TPGRHGISCCWFLYLPLSSRLSRSRRRYRRRRRSPSPANRLLCRNLAQPHFLPKQSVTLPGRLMEVPPINVQSLPVHSPSSSPAANPLGSTLVSGLL